MHVLKTIMCIYGEITLLLDVAYTDTYEVYSIIIWN